MKIIKKVLPLLASLSTVVACNTASQINNEIRFLDIKDAQVLYTVETSLSPTKSYSSKCQLFKINHNKQTSEIIVTDANGNPIEMESAIVKNLTDDLIYFSYYVNPNNYYYIVRKSDGAVFIPPSDIAPALGNKTYVDGDNNMYSWGYPIQSTYASVFKTSTHDGGFSAQSLTAEYSVGIDFLADHSGNLIFDILGDKVVLRTVNDGRYYVGASMYCNQAFCLNGISGFWMFDWENLSELRPNEQTNTVDKIVVRKLDTPIGSAKIYDVIAQENETILLREGSIVVIKGLDNIKNIQCYFNQSSYDNIQRVNDYYFWSEKPGHLVNNKVFRFDVKNAIVDAIFYNENYTVEDFTCNIDGGITFTGMNLSIGRKVKCDVVNGMIIKEVMVTEDETYNKVVNFIQIR